MVSRNFEAKLLATLFTSAIGWVKRQPQIRKHLPGSSSIARRAMRNRQADGFFDPVEEHPGRCFVLLRGDCPRGSIEALRGACRQ
jgi:hypothetical protein